MSDADQDSRELAQLWASYEDLCNKGALTKGETLQLSSMILDKAVEYTIEGWKRTMRVWDLSEADVESVLKDTLTYILNGRKR